jgi:PAS domain S-box-containing protein
LPLAAILLRYAFHHSGLTAEIESGTIMPDKDSKPLGRGGKSQDLKGRVETETIDIASLFTEDLTSSGSFDIRGGIWATTFGKVMQVMPVPAMLVDEHCHIFVANQACGRINPDYESILGRPFASLFRSRSDAANAVSVAESVLTSRKSRVLRYMVEIGGNGIWGRITYRPVRIAQTRFILVLIEDLTLERNQRLLDKKRHEDLETLVKQRTSDLESLTQTLRKEIANRKAVERDLRSSEASYRELVHGVNSIILRRDLHGNVTFFNRFAQEFFGFTEEEILGQNVVGTIVPATDSSGRDLAQLTMDIGRNPERYAHVEQENIRRNGDRAWVSWTNKAITDHDGNTIGILSVGNDITAEKKANELLMRSARIKAIGDMASGIAHNFNNVLQIVMNGAYELLADLESDDVCEAQSKIKRIIKSVAAGAETVRRLQDFAHARADEALARGKLFDLSSTVEQTLEILKPYWKTHPEKQGVRIALEKNLARGCLVRGKESELFEVVVNLVKNAVEALPHGGAIRVSAFVENDWVWLKVEDNGVGIAQQDLERVFEPFWSTKGVDGIGMGLASSYGIVRRHKGEIYAETALGSGAVFTVKLPLERGQPEKRPAPLMDRSHARLRILIVDDSEDSVWVLATGLERAGQEVLAALSGRRGIEILEHECVDAVICDLGMPEINGWDVGKTLRETCAKKGVPKPPFILLTGWGGLLCEELKLAECGVDRVVEKPFMVKNLLEIVRELLESGNESPGEADR